MKIDIQFCMNFKKIGIFLFLIFIAFISGFLANMYDIYPSEIKEFYIANENSNEIQVTLGNEKIEINETIKNSSPSSLEKSVLEKIK